MIQDGSIDERRLTYRRDPQTGPTNSMFHGPGRPSRIPVAAEAPVRLCRWRTVAKHRSATTAILAGDLPTHKDPRRVADRLDVYEGQQSMSTTPRDLRASGFCTDRLNSVFHLGASFRVTERGAAGHLVERGPPMSFGALGSGVGPRAMRNLSDTLRRRRSRYRGMGPIA